MELPLDGSSDNRDGASQLKMLGKSRYNVVLSFKVCHQLALQENDAGSLSHHGTRYETIVANQ